LKRKIVRQKFNRHSGTGQPTYQKIRVLCCIDANDSALNNVIDISSKRFYVDSVHLPTNYLFVDFNGRAHALFLWVIRPAEKKIRLAADCRLLPADFNGGFCDLRHRSTARGLITLDKIIDLLWTSEK
jgi:hypothetical protein